VVMDVALLAKSNSDTLALEALQATLTLVLTSAVMGLYSRGILTSTVTMETKSQRMAATLNAS